METILVAAEASWIREQVAVAFVSPGQRVVGVKRGQDVRAAVDKHDPDLVILDMQIANMGGIAVAIDLRLEESGGRLPRQTVLLLLDREADRFLAQRADVDGVLLKPIDAGTLRRAAKQLMSPVQVAVAPPSVDEPEVEGLPEPVEVAASSED